MITILNYENLPKMLSVIISSLAAASALTFGAKPLPYQFLKGEQTARKRGIDRCEEDARVVLGTWFNGQKKESVEELVFLTPGLLSRWLGYRKAEGWEDAQIRDAWITFGRQTEGRNLAIIRLSRLCKLDVFESDSFQNSNPEALDSVQLRIREEGSPWQNLNLDVIQDIQERSQAKVLVDRWDEVASSALNWPSEPSKFELKPEIRWGKNRRIGAIVEIPTFSPGAKLELEIKEPDRKRNLKFKFPSS